MKRLMAVLFAGVLVLAACSDDGGSDDDADATTTTAAEAETISLDEWVEEADAICEEANEAVDEIGEPEDLDDLREMAPDVVEIFQQQLDDLEALGLPDEQADDVERALELLDEQIALIEDLEDAEDEAEVEDIIAEGTELDEEASEIAQDLGLEVCGSDTDSDSDDTDTTETTDATSSDGAAAWDTGDPIADAIAEQSFNGLLAAGFNETESECIVSGVLDAFTVDELVEIAESGDQTEIREASEAATLECVSTERLVEIGSSTP